MNYHMDMVKMISVIKLVVNIFGGNAMVTSQAETLLKSELNKVNTFIEKFNYCNHFL